MQENVEYFTKIIERLSYYIDNQGGNFNKLSLAIGVSNSYFSKMAKNKGSLGEDIIRKILLYYDNINPEWLLTGEGEMLRTQALAPQSTPLGAKCPNCAANEARVKDLSYIIEVQRDLISELKEKREDWQSGAENASVADVG